MSYPLLFEAPWVQAMYVPLDGAEVRLASPTHLVKMKREADRPNDIDDIKASISQAAMSGNLAFIG